MEVETKTTGEGQKGRKKKDKNDSTSEKAYFYATQAIREYMHKKC